MINLNTVLNDRIARIARKEIKAQTGTTKKATTRYRSDIASLKREVQRLTRRLAQLEKQTPRQSNVEPAELSEGVRYSRRSVKAQRARLGLSAADFGKLVGVSMQTIYHWETGKSRPRPQQLARLVAVRALGRREATRRLQSSGDGDQAAPRRGRRGPRQARQPALPPDERFIQKLVKGRRATTGAAINIAWKNSGRDGTADKLLAAMVKGGKLKISKTESAWGNYYEAR